MPKKDLVYLLDVLESSNWWKLPIHWDAKKKELHFHPKLKLGYFMTNIVVVFLLGSVLFLLGRETLSPKKSKVSALILIFNVIVLVLVVFDVFLERLHYCCGPQLVSISHHAEIIRTRLRSRGN
jgi:hypothetical protein